MTKKFTKDENDRNVLKVGLTMYDFSLMLNGEIMDIDLFKFGWTIDGHVLIKFEQMKIKIEES